MSEHHIQLEVSPGKAHERLAVLERRHQVVRRSIELFLFESGDFSDAGIINALNYVIPQVNRQPNVHGYSPMQWTLGYQPSLPGCLTDEQVSPSTLLPTEAFKKKLEYQQLATMTISKASSDERLRRALLRQYRGNMTVLQLGDKCFYYRDLPTSQGAIGPKITWRGPATIVMVEPEHKIYWVSHGASLIRASFEHVKPVPNSLQAEDDLPRLDRAKDGLAQIRNRGTTRFLDLTKTNRRSLTELDSDDEMDQPDDDDDDAPHGLPDHPGALKRTSSEPLDEPSPSKAARGDYDATPLIPTGDMDFEYSPTTPRDDDSVVDIDVDQLLDEPLGAPEVLLPQPPVDQEPFSQQPGNSEERQTVGSGGSHPTAPELPTTTTSTQENGTSTVPAPTGETFEEMRQRYDRHETQLYRPTRSIPGAAARRHEEQPYDPKIDPTLHQAEVDILQDSRLPSGWSINEHGYMQLGPTEDEWQLKGNYLVRRHYVARDITFQPQQDECPIDLAFLQKHRDTYDGNQHYHDRWKHGQQRIAAMWTGYTRFRISPTHRKQAAEQFYSAAMTAPHMKKTNNLNERNMPLNDRLAFQAAKKKELESFFTNNVWVFDELENAKEDRILAAHFILKWSTNSDGTPRAKARLIVQGFRDPDALAGRLRTNSPTLTRLARGNILSVASILGFKMFGSDISTAFLQGGYHDEDRTLWIRLPRDAKTMLGLSPDDTKVMKLKKSMYGLVDAPRSWYVEATRRILEIPNIVQHPLDACCFMVYDPDKPSQLDDNIPGELVAIFGIHVDDMLGCGNIDSKVYQETKAILQEKFSFRIWQEDTNMEYCGCKIDLEKDFINLHQSPYLKKMKPITISEDRKKTPGSSLTPKETSMLRGLIGGLQWPSTQTAPYLQCAVSQLAGEVPSATIQTLENGNKILRMAKANSDVGLQYHQLGGNPKEITFLAYSDASFASRKDLSSQGGYLVTMVHKDVCQGHQGSYNMMDWRSWKLPRIARSSLSAESQACSEASDALLFCCTFWKLLWCPHLPLEDLQTPKLVYEPAMVIDVKALYDLLTKDEIQAACGADRRTAIETMVCQDKLRLCSAVTKWVSSELQYADSLTKSDTGQLLADRLRTHLTRIHSDESFQAAKRKDPKTRRKGAEMFALKRPTKAMQALLTCCTTIGVCSHELPTHYEIKPENNFEFYALLLFTIVISISFGFLLKYVQKNFFQFFTRPGDASIQTRCELLEKGMQTDRTALMDHRDAQWFQERADDLSKDLEGARNKIRDLTDELRVQGYELQSANDEIEQLRIQVETARNEYQVRDRERTNTVAQLQMRSDELAARGATIASQTARVRTEIANEREARADVLRALPIFTVPNGECYHVNFRCLQQRARNDINSWRPCAACVLSRVGG